jgi:hypothetical protein
MDSASMVVAEFSQFINEATFVHGLALGGARTIAGQMSALPVTPSNPNPLVSIGSGNPNIPGTTIVAQLRRTEVIEKARLGGSVEYILGQQWIVFVYAAWEGEYRVRLAEVHKCNVNDLQYPIIGDIRLLRHDVAHHRGIASADHSGKCVVMKPWIAVGSPIHVTHDVILNILRNVPFAEMEVGPSMLKASNP